MNSSAITIINSELDFLALHSPPAWFQGQTITYTYDSMNRRDARTDENGTTQYLYGNPNHHSKYLRIGQENAIAHRPPTSLLSLTSRQPIAVYIL
ncbi:hypothetical protein [Argonema galeatum]|uniref:hypothetical protein n=1 Tax=Argonema galeatum TaxID=2942762 RepID=UPI002012AF95|nr:hypothetical protein [Argonema galeatum]MCL1466084.1 hypothetical protein [Argonema galeatum A003/A1]